MTKQTFDYDTHPFSDTRVKDIDFHGINLEEQYDMYGTDYGVPDQCLYSNNGKEMVISHLWEVNPVTFLPDEHPLFRDFIDTSSVDPDATEEQIEVLHKAEEVLLAWVTDWCKELGIEFWYECLEFEYSRWEFCATEPLDSEATMREVEERLDPMANLVTVGSYALHQHLVDWANDQEEV